MPLWCKTRSFLPNSTDYYMDNVLLKAFDYIMSQSLHNNREIDNNQDYDRTCRW